VLELYGGKHLPDERALPHLPGASHHLDEAAGLGQAAGQIARLRVPIVVVETLPDRSSSRVERH
jgi:hypothetical protein